MTINDFIQNAIITRYTFAHGDRSRSTLIFTGEWQFYRVRVIEAFILIYD